MEIAVSLMSMTGFGKAALEHDGIALEVELRSVNSRFLDFVFKLPRAYAAFESALRDLIGARLSRGRVEVLVMRTPRRKEACRLEFNRALFDAYLALCGGVAAELKCYDDGLKARFVRDILLNREVLAPAEGGAQVESEKDLLLSAAGQALDGLCEMRVAEGRRLAADIAARCRALCGLREQVVLSAAAAPAGLKARLIERVRKLAPEVLVDENRLAAEASFLADRADVTEELVRLESHLLQMQAALGAPASGRKLEFLLQEVGREWNTVASKAQDAQVQKMAVEAKCEIEKIKEQALNLE